MLLSRYKKTSPTADPGCMYAAVILLLQLPSEVLMCNSAYSANRKSSLMQKILEDVIDRVNYKFWNDDSFVQSTS